MTRSSEPRDVLAKIPWALLTILTLTTATALVSAVRGTDLAESGGPATGLALQAKAAAGTGPVLPLPATTFEAAGLHELHRDPALVRLIPEDEGDAARLAQELKEIRDDLSRAKGARQAELHQQAYVAAATLAYYFENLRAGTAGGDGRSEDQAAASAGLTSMRGLVRQHAAAYVALVRDASRTRALYHLNAAALAGGTDAGTAARALADLAAGKGGARLTGALKTRAQTLAALYQMDHGDATRRAEALRTLKAQIRSFVGAGRVALAVSIGRGEAGLGAGGSRRATANAGYRQYLAEAAQRSKSLNAGLRRQTLAASISIWRRAEGGQGAWARPPFSLAAYRGEPAVLAVRERAALEQWSAGQRPQAVAAYARLARDAGGTPARAALDLRLLDLRRGEYVRTRQARPYETALLAAYKTYLDPGVLGDGQDERVKATAADIAGRHRAFVHAELGRCLAQATPAGERRTAIAVAERYLPTVSDDQEIEQVRAKVAALYALNGNHREAVSIYKQLAETTRGDSLGYWTRAIASQSVLASWPAAAPWAGIKAGAPAEREELGMLYKKLGEARKGLDWHLAAHLGLLELALDRQEQAFALWQAQLKQSTAGEHAANAVGTMLTAYAAAKSWGELETLARLALTQKMRPVRQGRALDAKALLALALLEGGKEALGQQNFALAVTKLKEFVSAHGDAANHDEGYYLLATAYRGAGQHVTAVKTLAAFCDRYQKSQYYRPALINGGDWSAGMAFEENAFHFWGRFVRAFAEDAEAPRIRRELTALYLGRSLYAEALGVINLTVRARGTEPAARSEAIALAMGIEERHGAATRAARAADLLLRSPGATDDMKAAALGLKIRQAAGQGRFDEVKTLAAQAGALSGDGAQEVTGEARYMLAVAHGKTAGRQLFNLALPDPMATLNERFKWYGQSRAMYEQVCEAGKTSFCAPAMHRLARMSERFMRAIEDISVQETLAKEVVAAFNSRKQGIMNEVTATAQRADARSVAVIAEGNTDPSWTQAVLWQNSMDWNFERVSGETGNGFVQWGGPASGE